MHRKGKIRLFEKGDMVAVVGKLHALHGKVGTVIQEDIYKKRYWQVKVGSEKFVVQGRYLQSLDLQVRRCDSAAA